MLKMFEVCGGWPKQYLFSFFKPFPQPHFFSLVASHFTPIGGSVTGPEFQTSFEACKLVQLSSGSGHNFGRFPGSLLTGLWVTPWFTFDSDTSWPDTLSRTQLSFCTPHSLPQNNLSAHWNIRKKSGYLYHSDFGSQHTLLCIY